MRLSFSIPSLLSHQYLSQPTTPTPEALHNTTATNAVRRTTTITLVVVDIVELKRGSSRSSSAHHQLRAQVEVIKDAASSAVFLVTVLAGVLNFQAKHRLCRLHGSRGPMLLKSRLFLRTSGYSTVAPHTTSLQTSITLLFINLIMVVKK